MRDEEVAGWLKSPPIRHDFVRNIIKHKQGSLISLFLVVGWCDHTAKFGCCARSVVG
jgi:hypothetical protein